ncbi:MAG: response regulator [Candidatus Cloacimonetes bacterium]|nr:response regulator [Candidatus Cloacimonadota bacterium]MCF7814373.1 response regulator [Candidatus Cloacimonadota bacterium]MCF7868996.1 response regulator [Candidatus Cloacimonadota bacterium]MCF7884390.1 response regulator [Candidatus Cloacimonadota bacterium]
MSRILLVEDNEANLYLIRYMLEKHNHEVIIAKEGQLGVDLALQKLPDLVIMDVQLPDINGLEATRRIRAQEKGKNLKIVALTSYAMPGDREKALNAGCDGYMEKPINPENFVPELEKYL